MAVKDWLGITQKTLDTIDRLNDEQINNLNKSLDRTFATLSKEMLNTFNNLQGADPNYIKVQLSKLNQLKIARQLLSPNQAKEFEKEFKQLLENQTSEGVKYADLMTEALTNPPELVQQFGTINIDTAAIAQQATERLKNHTKEASQKIMDAVSDNLLKGGSVQQLSKDLQGILGTTKARAETIARTETITAFNQASRNRYQEYGAEYLQIIAIVDQRTTPWCRYRHLRIIKITDSVPSYHYRCRSTTAPVDPKWIDEEDLKWMQEEMKRAKDTGLNISGKAPFDTKVPTFITPKTFAKTTTSTPPPPKQKNTRKPKPPTPAQQPVTQDFNPSQGYPKIDDLTKDGAIRIGDEYIKWVQSKLNLENIDPFNPPSNLPLQKVAEINKFIYNDLLERGKNKFVRKGWDVNDYYEIRDFVQYREGLSPKQAQKLKPIVEETIYFFGGMIRPEKRSFIYDDPRAYHNKQDKIINVGDDINKSDLDLKRVVFHEVGHAFEQQSQTFINNSAQYVLDKATGAKEKLSKLTGNSSYRDNEMAYPDDFIDPYAGKIYERDQQTLSLMAKYSIGNQKVEKYTATEIFSMGLEELHDPDRLFTVAMAKDPNHLKYMIGTLLVSHNDN